MAEAGAASATATATATEVLVGRDNEGKKIRNSGHVKKILLFMRKTLKINEPAYISRLHVFSIGIRCSLHSIHANAGPVFVSSVLCLWKEKAKQRMHAHFLFFFSLEHHFRFRYGQLENEMKTDPVCFVV